MEERFTPFSFSVKYLDFSTSASKKYTTGFSLCDLAMESGRVEYLAEAVKRFSSWGAAKKKAAIPKTIVRKKKRRVDLRKKEKRSRAAQPKGQSMIEWEKKLTGTGKRLTPTQRRRYRYNRNVPTHDPIFVAGLIIIKGDDDDRKVLVVRQDGQVQLPKAKKKNNDTLVKTAKLGLRQMTGLRLPEEASEELTMKNVISIRDFVPINAYQKNVPRTMTFFVVYLNNEDDLQNVDFDEATARAVSIIQEGSGLASDLVKLIMKFCGNFWVDKSRIEFIRLSWLVDKRNRRGVDKKTISILDKLQKEF